MDRNDLSVGVFGLFVRNAAEAEPIPTESRVLPLRSCGRLDFSPYSCDRKKRGEQRPSAVLQDDLRAQTK